MPPPFSSSGESVTRGKKRGVTKGGKGVKWGVKGVC